MHAPWAEKNGVEFHVWTEKVLIKTLGIQLNGNPLNESILDKFKKNFELVLANRQKGFVGWFKSKIQQGLQLASCSYKGEAEGVD